MGKYTDGLKKRLGLVKGEAADPLQANMERPSDPMLTAIKLTNESDAPLHFISTLEKNSILEETAHWKLKILSPGESEIFPHCYFECSREDGGECQYRWEPAPRGSDFIYKTRDIVPVESATPHRP